MQSAVYYAKHCKSKQARLVVEEMEGMGSNACENAMWQIYHEKCQTQMSPKTCYLSQDIMSKYDNGTFPSNS